MMFHYDIPIGPPARLASLKPRCKQPRMKRYKGVEDPAIGTHLAYDRGFNLRLPK